jgi:hypothetical protein
LGVFESGVDAGVLAPEVTRADAACSNHSVSAF